MKSINRPGECRPNISEWVKTHKSQALFSVAAGLTSLALACGIPGPSQSPELPPRKPAVVTSQSIFPAKPVAMPSDVPAFFTHPVVTDLNNPFQLLNLDQNGFWPDVVQGRIAPLKSDEKAFIGLRFEGTNNVYVQIPPGNFGLGIKTAELADAEGTVPFTFQGTRFVQNGVYAESIMTANSAGIAEEQRRLDQQDYSPIQLEDLSAHGMRVLSDPRATTYVRR